MKVHIARNGEVLGEWTQTELYPLLRASEVFPGDYYWHEGMTEWRRLAELPSGKNALATQHSGRCSPTMEYLTTNLLLNTKLRY